MNEYLTDWANPLLKGRTATFLWTGRTHLTSLFLFGPPRTAKQCQEDQRKQLVYDWNNLAFMRADSKPWPRL